MYIRSNIKRVALCALISLSAATAGAQSVLVPVDSLDEKMVPDNLELRDGHLTAVADSLAKVDAEEEKALMASLKDTLAVEKQPRAKRDWNTWRPNAKRALWLALVLPGAGQIYNRKYWKLPIVYGGFVGCIYAMKWNNQMLHDYSQAYIDIMDSDPNTQSYNQFLHLGTQITSANEARYKELFRKRKDFYRRYRDLSFFCLLAVYALSVIDAYVDASLSEFDISKDLSMRVSPQVISDKSSMASRNPVKSTAVGLQCSLNF